MALLQENRAFRKLVLALGASGILTLFLGAGVFYAMAQSSSCPSGGFMCSDLAGFKNAFSIEGLSVQPNTSQNDLKTALSNAFSQFLSEDTPGSVPATLGKKSIFEKMGVAPKDDGAFRVSFHDNLTSATEDNPELILKDTDLGYSVFFWNSGDGIGLGILPSQNDSDYGLQGRAEDGSGISASGKNAGIYAKSTSKTGLEADSQNGIGAKAVGDSLGLYTFGENTGLKADGSVLGTTTGGEFGVVGKIQSGAWGALGAYQNGDYYGIYTENNAKSSELFVSGFSSLSGLLTGTNLSEAANATEGATIISSAGFSNKPTVSSISSSFPLYNSLDISGKVTIGGNLKGVDSSLIPGFVLGGLKIGGVISSSGDTVMFSNSATVTGNANSLGAVTADQGIGKFYQVISNIGYGKTTAFCANKSNQALASCGESVYNSDEYAGAQKVSVSSTVNGLTFQKLGCQAYAQSSNKALRAIAYCFDPLGVENSSGEMDVSEAPSIPACADGDFDGECDSADNCSNISNPDQKDSDGDGRGDVCDNCKTTSNASQADTDSDGIGDSCDNCKNSSNAGQEDFDNDGDGDVCDNCKTTENADQKDSDNDDDGDSCDNCKTTSNADQKDSDNDGDGDSCDNCKTTSNADQKDSDNDGDGDSCDNCKTTSNADQENSDSDSYGDACDNCATVSNADQKDSNNDGIGDVCDNCPPTAPATVYSSIPSGSDTITFTWSAVTSAKNYCYKVVDALGSSVKQEVCTSDASTLSASWSIFDFADKESYTFKVAAKNSGCPNGETMSSYTTKSFSIDYDDLDFDPCDVQGASGSLVWDELCGGADIPFDSSYGKENIDGVWLPYDPCEMKSGSCQSGICQAGASSCFKDDISVDFSGFVDVFTDENSLVEGWSGTDDAGNKTGDLSMYAAAYMLDPQVGALTANDIAHISDSNLQDAIMDFTSQNHYDFSTGSWASGASFGGTAGYSSFEQEVNNELSTSGGQYGYSSGATAGLAGTYSAGSMEYNASVSAGNAAFSSGMKTGGY